MAKVNFRKSNKIHALKGMAIDFKILCSYIKHLFPTK